MSLLVITMTNIQIEIRKYYTKVIEINAKRIAIPSFSDKMLMSLSIHIHGLHPGVQYDQTWHLLTQLRALRSRLLCMSFKSAQMGSCPITFFVIVASDRPRSTQSTRAQ